MVQTGAWLLPDERPLPADLVAFLDAGTPPVYVGFGSMPLLGAKDVGRTADRGGPRARAGACCSPAAGPTWT